MSPKQVARIVVTFLLIASVIWLGRNRQFYTEAVVSIFFACTLTSVSVIHFRIHPSWRDALLVFCGTFLFAVIDFQLLHFRPMFASWFSFAGLSSLAILGVRAVWAEGAFRKLLALGFVPALLLVGASNLLEWTATAHPKVLDLYLYSFDASLRLQFPFIVRAACHLCNACDTTSWYVIDFKRTLNFDEAPEEQRLFRIALQDQYRRGQVMGLAHAAHATQC